MPMEFLKNVFILFNVEKHLSLSTVVIGMVTIIFKIVTHSEKVRNMLLSRKNCNKGVAPEAIRKSSRLYNTSSSVLSFGPFIVG